MITNPKDFFQQTQNFVEEVALKIKAINGSLPTFLTKSDAEATYLEKTEASNTYLGKDEKAASATVADSATSANKATNDANGNNISNTYLKNTAAQSTYLSKTDASSTYLEKTGKAASATTADSATKATQDGNGAVIANTYVKTVNGTSPVNGNVSVDIALTKDKITSALGYTPLQTAPVTSVNSMTGAVTITAGGTSAYQIPYATCSTASNTAVKVATIANSISFALKVGSIVAVKMTNAPTKMTHLNVNSTGQKPVKGFNVSLSVGYRGTDECHFDIKPTGLVYVFVYDGTNWNAVSAYGGYEYVPDYDEGGD